MPYNGSGVFSLAASISPGDPQTAAVLMTILNDIKDGLSVAVARDGQSSLTGPVKASNGSAAAPSYTFASDPNTGIYRRGADQIGAAVNGAEVGYFSAAGWNGNVAGDVTGDLTGGWAYLPAGTRCLFQQTAAPTGWAKDTTHNNKALRIVSGTVSSGGSMDFTSAFTSRTVPLPVHTHGITDPGHTHTYDLAGVNAGSSYANADRASVSLTRTTNSHQTGITINNAGTGDTLDFSVAYVDVIIAQKD